MVLLSLLALVIFACGLCAVDAGSVTHGGSCDISHQRLEPGTYQFYTECDAMTYCSSAGKCELKGCRKDQFPFGYSTDSALPPMCGSGHFCPDEEDQCLPILPVGSACQFNRDDQCEGPPNHRTLADHTGFGLNVNGSVCLNNVCMWANASAGESCIVQNTVFVAFGQNGHDYPDIVSRDNCQPGLYCDGKQLQCLQTKEVGTGCSADKECLTYNCLASGVCGARTDVPRHVATWVYALVGIGSCGGVFATLFGMVLVHKKEREAERDKRMSYWQEQNALRQNFMQIQRTAHDSISSMAAGSSRSPLNASPFRDDPTYEEMQAPAAPRMTRSSALRFSAATESEWEGSRDSFLMQRLGEKRDFGKT